MRANQKWENNTSFDEWVLLANFRCLVCVLFVDVIIMSKRLLIETGSSVCKVSFSDLNSELETWKTFVLRRLKSMKVLFLSDRLSILANFDPHSTLDCFHRVQARIYLKPPSARNSSSFIKIDERLKTKTHCQLVNLVIRLMTS